MNIFRAFLQLGAGLSVGLSGLAAGFAVGIVGDAGVRGTAQQPRLVDSFFLFSKDKDKKKKKRTC
jgi:F0F1-type ATP synthase membrane subunit c/vacuolar-type H+-ATPase subunit K